MLELGPYEGRSTFWFLENILTGSGNKITLVDSYNQNCEQYQKALKNFNENKKKYRGDTELFFNIQSSKQFLKTTNESYDLVFIDASPVAKDRLMDAMLAWDRLKENGILIIDDYDRSPKMPLEFRPKFAIDTFITLFRNEMKILKKSSFFAFEKNSKGCDALKYEDNYYCNDSLCGRIGDYEFYMKNNSILRDTVRNKSCQLKESQKADLLEIFKSRDIGIFEFGTKEQDQLKTLINQFCKGKFDE